MSSWPTRMSLSLASLLVASSATAQLLPGGVLQLPGQVVGGILQPAMPATAAVKAVTNTLDAIPVTEGLDPASLLDLKRQRLRLLIHDNRAVLESDGQGNPVRRGEVIAIDPAPQALANAEKEGFARLREERIDGLDITVLVLAPPKGKSSIEALKTLRELDPQGQYELNHIFEPAGAAIGPGGSVRPSTVAGVGGAIGMIDGGISAHPALAGASIEQRGFTPGGPKGSGHGTAIASLLVGSDGRFSGAARGWRLLAADVYGGQPAAGSAEAIVQAMAWLSQQHVKVVTISLVGPANRLLERGVKALRARGIAVVAAVGNDGPAAPPQYPASYPGVIAVTAVDARDHALLEAGRASHLDFAAPGADMAAALPGRGYAVVRGTSFAAPLVAARIALNNGNMQPVQAEVQPGKGRVGNGILCRACRVEPKSVGAKR